MSKQFESVPKNRTNVRVENWKRSALRAGLTTAWTLAPRATENRVEALFFRPAAYPLSEEGARWLKTGRAFRISVGEKTVQGWEWGHGPAVLFVHGWNGSGYLWHSYHYSQFRRPFGRLRCHWVGNRNLDGCGWVREFNDNLSHIYNR